MKSEIKQIFSKYDIQADAITPLTGGEQTSVFKITSGADYYCIKMNKIKDEKRSLALEQNSMNILTKMGIDTPTPLFLDTVGGYEYLIMSYESGNLLSNKWHKLDISERVEYLNQIFNVFPAFERIRVNGFGHLDQDFKGPYNSYREYLLSNIENLKINEVSKRIKEETYKQIETIFNNYQKRIKKPTYVHGDIRLRNFIVGNSGLVVFDFSNASGMDPVFELTRFITTDTWKAGLSQKEAKDFIERYKKEVYKGSDFEKDYLFNKLLLTVNLLPWLHDHKKTYHTNLYLRRLDSSINKLLDLS